VSDGQVQLTIDGLQVSVPAGTTVFDAARMNGIPIPTLCHQQNETPVGVCRVCVVDVGARVFAASCVRPAENNMVVNTGSDKVKRARRTLIELLMADHPSPCARQQHSGDCELETLARLEGITQPRFPRRISPRGQDNSSLVIAVDHEACILCDRCIRGCDEIRHNDVLGRRGKGFMAGIAFDYNLPMGNSSCVSCGECMV
jgi:predicted molibdopterin-dependent oxidoreductase YjgC